MSDTRSLRTRTPRPVATSSPIASKPSGAVQAASGNETARRTTTSTLTRGIVTPAKEPALHSWARWAASSGALTMSRELRARSAAEQPIPTSTTRTPVTRTPPAHATMRAPEARPPISAPAEVVAGLAPSTMIATSAPVAQPVDSPTMSGLPSGLPDSVWKIAPATPSEHPTATAAITRGRRTDWTKYTPRKSSVGPPSPTRRRSDCSTLSP